MIEVEIIQNPILPVVTLCVLLCALTALAFIAILFACGITPEDIAEANA